MACFRRWPEPVIDLLPRLSVTTPSSTTGQSKLKVKRIVANFKTLDPKRARTFYQDVLGLDLLMDHGWIQTLGSPDEMTIQVSFAT